VNPTHPVIAVLRAGALFGLGWVIAAALAWAAYGWLWALLLLLLWLAVQRVFNHTVQRLGEAIRAERDQRGGGLIPGQHDGPDEAPLT